MKKFLSGKKLKRGLSAALVLVMVSSSVMPAYADGTNMNLSENASYSNEHLTEESLEDSVDPIGEDETIVEEGGKKSQETEEESVNDSGYTEETVEETKENIKETEEKPEETEESVEETIEETEQDNVEESKAAIEETEAETQNAEQENIGEIVNQIAQPDLAAVEAKNIELAGDYKDGTYTGRGKGLNGTITLKVTIADNKIKSIVEISQSETPSRWEMAKRIFNDIIDANSTDVDAISSATYSSEGIIEAVNDALSKAESGNNQVFEDGSGSKSDPYIIAESAQLERFAEEVNEGKNYKGAYIELSNDLELSGEWTPIGTKEKPFAGLFSGKGFTISGLSIQDNAMKIKDAGLFGYLAAGAKVSDLKLADVNISSDAEASQAGGIAGSTDKEVIIDHCEVYGTIEANKTSEVSRAGGIVGWLGEESIVSNVYADINVAAFSGSKAAFAGGITGVSQNKCIIINAAAFGIVSAKTEANIMSCAGGVFGTQTGTAFNVFSDCEVTGESADQNKVLTGGISGMASKNTAIFNGYFNSSTPDAFMTASSTVNGYISEHVEGLSDSELNSSEFAVTLNRGLTRSQRASAFTRISEAGNQNMGDLERAIDSLDIIYAWDFNDKVVLSEEAFADDSIDTGIFESGSGTEEDPYILKTEEQLRTFAKSLSSEVTYSGIYVALEDDIDVSSETWIPIGLGHYDFKGIFDGRDHKITGINIGTTEIPYEEENGDSENSGKMTTYYGFFGVVGENAVIKNLGIEDSVISVKNSTAVYAGLLAGITEKAYIDSCYTKGYVSGETTNKKANAWTGGLVSQTIRGGIINSWTDTEVYCTAIGGLAESGGLIGMTNRSVVANCFALGNTGGKASREDGNEGMPAVSSFIGVNAGKVANCYATGDMTSDSFSTYVGSFSGWSTGIARQFLSYYNTEAVQNSNGTVNNPAISVGYMVSAGVNDEGEPYDGTYHVGIEAKELSFMNSQEFADLLNSNYSAFPLDLVNGESSNTGNQNAMGLPDFMKLKEWHLENEVVMPVGETVETTYKDMTPAFEPDTLAVADGTYYGRSKGPGGDYIYVKLTVVESRISEIDLTNHSEGSKLDLVAADIINSVISTQNYSQSGQESELEKALKSAIAVAAKKASIRDLTGYGTVSDSIFASGNGTKENPYMINTAEQMVEFAGSLNEDEHYEGKFVKLGANISLEGVDWIPAGGSGVYGFRGTFDGNNKVISHMTIGSEENPEIYCKSVGLFANLEAARINNLGIEKALIYHRYLGDSIAYAGILSGYYIENAGDAGYIDFCYATGTVNSYSAKQNDSAGLLGTMNRGTIANSYTLATINSESRDGYAYAGGICGLLNRALIINSYATGNVKGKGNGARIQVGGIMGMNAGVAINNYANVDLVTASTTVDIGGYAGRVSGIGYAEKAYYNNESRQISGSLEILPAKGVGTIVSGINYGKGIVVDLEGKRLSDLKSSQFADVLNKNKADTEMLGRVNRILEELSSPMPSGITLRDFQYSADENGVVFKDRVAGSQDGGSVGGDSSDNDSSDESEGTGSSTKYSDSLTNRSVKAQATVTANAVGSGSADISVSDQVITDAIARALSDARMQGKTANGISIGIDIVLPKDTSSLTATFSQNALESLIRANVQNFDINGTLVTIALNKKSVEEICRQSGDNITISIKPAAVNGVRNCYDITINSVKNGETVTVTSLNEGTSIIGIPYIPANGEEKGRLFGAYVDGNGNVSRISNSVYDSNNRQVIFRTNHFSVYGVGYMASFQPFTDTTDHWAMESIDYAAGRGLLSGTSDGAFSPDSVMTREMLVIALAKLTNADVSSYTGSSFTDTEGNGNTPYIEWAYKNGIIKADGGSEFAPGAAVTREEMAMVMQNYARATGYALPVTRSEISFVDGGSIGGSAKAAVISMQKAGIMMGERDGSFNPKGSMTRAQTAVIFERYSKLILDLETAEGWARNDSGQYLYYKNGLAVTGTQIIDGVTYQFSSNGIMK